METISHELWMKRCIELAKMGLGKVQPNPMVGAVIVYHNQIIGEGFHQRYGEAHAEINAINSVKDPSLLKKSTIYVSLEPCSHFGKTPPCADKLIELGFPKVVVGCSDPHDKVNGKGISKLQNAGIEVVTNVLHDECIELNKRFFTFHQQKRPYIILKWAQTADGFMDIDRTEPAQNYWITNDELRIIVHKWRSEEDAILVGYNTFLNDHPQLTNRLYPGKSPQRYIMANHFSDIQVPDFKVISSDISTAMLSLYNDNMQSVIVEGGRKTLDLFLRNNCWDEARILIGNQTWGKGLPAPIIDKNIEKEIVINDNKIRYIRNV
ncbi:MAG: bifunctional diaminohydroxyphosphoribosylaminopyrimidine deaminase/5-amino-6-(5-phosphoribosylamino)uracil reductase RibD [Bacteroidales bacterium]|nr:bifunctional diaminohydroxyphosphoribosylaminopyrimidine deaminase/5-amino-6-(5-phosphoribosylamino)uracil reductase RibD [Bacteroidales bacterium]